MSEFFVIAHYTQAYDEHSSYKGLFDVTIYQHKTLLLTCEMRKYKHAMECISHGFKGDNRVSGKMVATTKHVEQSHANTKELFLTDAANKMSEFYNDRW